MFLNNRNNNKHKQESELISILTMRTKKGAKRDESKETLTKEKTKFLKHGNFDFLTASHKIKFGEI